MGSKRSNVSKVSKGVKVNKFDEKLGKNNAEWNHGAKEETEATILKRKLETAEFKLQMATGENASLFAALKEARQNHYNSSYQATQKIVQMAKELRALSGNLDRSRTAIFTAIEKINDPVLALALGVIADSSFSLVLALNKIADEMTGKQANSQTIYANLGLDLASGDSLSKNTQIMIGRMS